SSQYSNNYYKINAIISGTAGTVLGTPILDSLMKINNFIDSVNKELITTSFKMDIFNINNGYPILFWQDSSSIITINASDINDSSAKINAQITNFNPANIISKGFYYKNSLDSNWSVVNGIGDTNMYANLTGLLPNTNYEFKAFFVTSQLNTMVGDILTFKTLHTPARVITDSASFIEPTRATLNGKIIRGSEPILTTGFYYKRGSSSSYMLINTYFYNTDTLEADISGLIAKTEYTYKAFATTPTDTIYGEDINFITPAPVSLDDENISNTKFVIYPNPAKEYINVKLDKMNKNTNIIIFDISGREISNYSFSPIDNNYNARINTSNLLKGVYTLKIITNETTIAKKFIIE
ncbi:MAG: Fibronectin type domain protein, partial [Bacteroidetes bacterium]|nr:Fibronectin type domain protein [Bacteroidota bacterium]